MVLKQGPRVTAHLSSPEVHVALPYFCQTGRYEQGVLLSISGPLDYPATTLGDRPLTHVANTDRTIATVARVIPCTYESSFGASGGWAGRKDLRAMPAAAIKRYHPLRKRDAELLFADGATLVH
jgi:hypothetical protein